MGERALNSALRELHLSSIQDELVIDPKHKALNMSGILSSHPLNYREMRIALTTYKNQFLFWGYTLSRERSGDYSCFLLSRKCTGLSPLCFLKKREK